MFREINHLIQSVTRDFVVVVYVSSICTCILLLIYQNLELGKTLTSLRNIEKYRKKEPLKKAKKQKYKYCMCSSTVVESANYRPRP